MNGSSIRVALVGSGADSAAQSLAFDRIRDAVVVVTAESIEAVIHRGIDFDAAVVSCSADARLAAQHGKHVLISAPLADNFKNAQFLIADLRRAGVKYSLYGLSQHHPAWQTITARCASGKLGKPGLLRIHRWRNQNSKSFASILFGDIHLALQLFNSLPSEIYAINRSNHRYSQVHLGYHDGGMAIMDFAELLPNSQHYDCLSMIGSTGAAYADDQHNTHLLLTGDQPSTLFSHRTSGFQLELQEFIRYVAQDTLPQTGDQAILDAHRVADVVVRSMEAQTAYCQRGDNYEPA